MAKKKRKKTKKLIRDRHLLYTAAVQSVDPDIDFFKRVYKRHNGRPFRTLREDFCGTAALACEWVRRNEKNRAFGIDLDQETLAWAAKHNVPALGKAAERLALTRGNVLDDSNPSADLIAALNFSFCVFKTRPFLLDYFRKVRSKLEPGGVFVLDIFGGTEAGAIDEEKRAIEACEAFDGRKVPSFTYVWDQYRFNPVDHHIVCRIHFKLADGTKLRRAFVYDWRLWTIPELRELLEEAGFARSDVYVEGWDEEADDTDGIFRRRKKFENQSGWVAYVVGLT